MYTNHSRLTPQASLQFLQEVLENPLLCLHPYHLPHLEDHTATDHPHKSERNI